MKREETLLDRFRRLRAWLSHGEQGESGEFDVGLLIALFGRPML